MSVAAGASTYAEALFQAAQAAGRLREVQRDLSAFARTLAESRPLAMAVFNPAFATDAKARVITQMTEGGDPLVKNALLVMLDNGRLELLPDVERILTDRFRSLSNEVPVTLTTAIPVDDATAVELAGRLEAASGRKVVLERVVDPSIIGGVVLRVRDQLVDASVRRRLDAMTRALAASRLPS